MIKPMNETIQQDDGVWARVGVDNGQVMVLFSGDYEGKNPTEVSSWRMDPKQALAICEAIATTAFYADSGLKPVGPASVAMITESKRMLLTQRFSLVLGTVRADKLVSDGKLAQDLVDIALKEVM